MIKYDRDKAIKAFESSKYKELGEIISYAEPDNLSSKELV